MPVIKVGTNRVTADEPGPDDTHVQVVWFGPSQDGKHRKVIEGPVEPIAEYEATLAWAVEMAGQMTHPLYVLPMTGVEVLRTEQVMSAVAGLDDQQRDKLRREMLATLEGVARVGDHPDARRDAFDLLKQLGAIQS